MSLAFLTSRATSRKTFDKTSSMFFTAVIPPLPWHRRATFRATHVDLTPVTPEAIHTGRVGLVGFFTMGVFPFGSGRVQSNRDIDARKVFAVQNGLLHHAPHPLLGDLVVGFLVDVGRQTAEEIHSSGINGKNMNFRTSNLAFAPSVTILPNSSVGKFRTDEMKAAPNDTTLWLAITQPRSR